MLLVQELHYEDLDFCEEPVICPQVIAGALI